ncbi:MAG: cobalamin biosynthesis protein CobD [Proteobacteria bacterium]|nr:cobalamin biosynthesis protein CobD [Pseudomonadota bacterium]
MIRLYESPELIGIIIIVCALLLDQNLGDPVYPLHPVRLMGKVISFVEQILFEIGFRGFLGGLILLIVMVGLVIVLHYFLLFVPANLVYLFDIFLIYSCLSAKDLQLHGQKVLDALETDNLVLAREEVQMIVGRDAGELDREGVVRAATESMAEGFVDGFFAPLFYLILGGIIFEQAGFSFITGSVIFVLIYRVVNTLDSMVGYKNERYLYFGKAAALTDDLLNFVPARLSIPLISFSAFLLGYQAGESWKIGWRDRLRHASPNAGHPESAVAGALGIQLGGPVIYTFGKVDKPWMGKKSGEISPSDLSKAMKLIQTSTLISGWGSMFVLGFCYLR